MSIYYRDGKERHINAKKIDVFDVTGAGDTVIAAFAFKLALGKTTSEAAEFSNIAASIAVQKRGAFAVKEKDFVVSNLNNLKEKKKLVTEKELSKIIMKLRKDDKRMVFTNGCFDILHSGHLAFLKSARKLADYLVVRLNSDYSVTQIKGKVGLSTLFFRKS